MNRPLLNKRFLLVSFLFSFFISLLIINQSYSEEIETNLERPQYVDGEVLVKYKDNDDLQPRKSFLSLNPTYQSSEENITQNNDTVIKKITDNLSVEEEIEKLSQDPNVESVQPNYIYYPTDTIQDINTNDQYISELWNLASTSVPSAWKINEGTTSPVVVAIIDEGVDYNHPDISSNMWDGTNCYSYKGVFLGNCIHGYDFYADDKDPIPTSSIYYHGTHVAGTISAIKNNGLGIVGIAPNSKIMAIRVGDNTFTTSNIVLAIKFAQKNGANIINASFGISCSNNIDFLCRDDYFENTIKSFPGLFISAAGNDARNNDAKIAHIYPSDFPLDNIISVASSNHSDILSSFSNYGTTSVDIAAPGSGIYSLAGNNSYGILSGTSMATPHIAGLAALIEGYNPNLTTSQVKNIILSTGDQLDSLNGKILSGRRMNAYNAMLASIPKSIVSFTFPDIQSTSTIDQDNHKITTEVPYGTDITKLKPSISISGVSIEPASESIQDFSTPINYIVTASDNTTNTYTTSIVLGKNPDINLVNSDKILLTNDLIKGKNSDLSNVRYSLSLPKTGSNGSTITWTSSDTSILSNDGLIINRPDFDSSDILITITATIKKGDVIDTKNFSINVLKLSDSDEDLLIRDKNYITENLIKGKNSDLSNVRYSLSLPKTGSNGSTITWTSSDTSVLSNNGLIVSKYNSANKTITLTATIMRTCNSTPEDENSAHTISDTKQFTITISNSIGHSFGGGGSSISTVNKTEKTTIIENTPEYTTTNNKTEYHFINTLDIGSTGTEVIELQKKLLSDGVYNGPITGYFGTLTYEGVKKYQQKNSLPQIGIVGPLTRKLLNSNNVSTKEILDAFIKLGIIETDKIDEAKKFFGL